MPAASFRATVDAAAPAGANPTPAESSQPAAGGAPTAARLGAIVVQSNDAYVLDNQKGEVYRCRISAHDCAVVLKTAYQFSVESLLEMRAGLPATWTSGL